MLKKWEWPKTPPTTAREVLLLCQVLLLTSVLRVLLRWVKLPRLLQWLTPTEMPEYPDQESLSIISRYGRSVLSRFPSNPRGSCLIRSLSLYGFGRRYGFPVFFHCGVRRTNTELTGHAWLSLDGKAFEETDDPFATNVVTFSYPSSSKEGRSGNLVSKDDRLTSLSEESQENNPNWPLRSVSGVEVKERL